MKRLNNILVFLENTISFLIKRIYLVRSKFPFQIFTIGITGVLVIMFAAASSIIVAKANVGNVTLFDASEGAGVGAVIFAVALAITGARNLFIVSALVLGLAGTSALGGAGGVGVAVAAIVSFAIALSKTRGGAISGALSVSVLGAISITVTRVSSPERAFVGALLFFFVLPIMNEGWDWISWGVSRALGRVILRLHYPLKSIAVALIDMLLAIVFLVSLTACLTIGIETINFYFKYFGLSPPVSIKIFIEAAAANPFGPKGIWVTLMLFSTLVPTFLHFIIALAGTFTRVLPIKWRRGLAEMLEEEESQIVQSAAHLLLFYFSTYSQFFRDRN